MGDFIEAGIILMDTQNLTTSRDFFTGNLKIGLDDEEMYQELSKKFSCGVGQDEPVLYIVKRIDGNGEYG